MRKYEEGGRKGREGELTLTSSRSSSSPPPPPPAVRSSNSGSGSSNFPRFKGLELEANDEEEAAGLRGGMAKKGGREGERRWRFEVKRGRAGDSLPVFDAFVFGSKGQKEKAFMS